MPRLTTIKNLIEAEKIKKIEQETTIPDSELPSNNCPSADHSMCDFLFEEYKDGRGVLIVKGKRIRITDDKFSEFTEFMKDKGENNNEN